MCDANQGWQPADAAVRIAALAPFKPYWIEEPIGADQPHAVWSALAKASAVPLAAGENLRGEQAFAEALQAGYLGFVQPDVGKWGGIGGGLAVARRAADAGVAYCPHWLAGGIGLAASMHVLAGSNHADGWAEVDANPNPLREQVFPLEVRDGWAVLSDAPGLGVEPDLRQLADFVVPISRCDLSCGHHGHCKAGPRDAQGRGGAACATCRKAATIRLAAGERTASRRMTMP
jgi:L-alanine-DL-glutamate epimerase-like enolase superfamily enzyme